MTQGAHTSALWQPRGAGRGGRWEGGSGGRRLRISMADSCWWMAETNTILQSNYPSTKDKQIFFKKGEKMSVVVTTLPCEKMLSEPEREAYQQWLLTRGHWPGCLHAKSLQLCSTLCDPMDCSPPGSSVHGILQARILEWVAMPSSRGSSQPRDQSCVAYVSCIAGRFSTTSTTWTEVTVEGPSMALHVYL